MATRYLELCVLALSGRSNLAIVHLDLLTSGILLVHDINTLLLLNTLGILVFTLHSLSRIDALAHVIIWSHRLFLEVRQILVIYQLLLLILLIRIIIVGYIAHFVA